MTQRLPFSTGMLALIVLLLFVHVWVRASNITVQPFFTDENSHINRAAVIYDFDRHPAVEAHGKLLFYFLPGIFDLKEFDTALHLARTSMALASAITGAFVFAIARRLLDARAGLIALFFYALVPYAVVFERMALAAAWSGTMGTILVWHSIRFAQAPSYRRALWVGVFVALTPMAKLTLSFVALMPVVAVWLFAEYDNLVHMVRRFFPYGFRAALMVVGIWSLVLVPAAYEDLTGGTPYLIYPTWLVETTTESATFLDKLEQGWERQVLLMSWPLSLLTLGVVAWRFPAMPRAMALNLVWLVLAWIPTYFIIGPDSFQSRYLMVGMAPIAVLLGMGLISALDALPPPPRWSLPLAGALMLAWALGFALPFLQTAATAPEDLTLPERDAQNYFYGPYNSYGIAEAYFWVRDNGTRYEGQSYVLGNTRFCFTRPDYYNLDDVMEYACAQELHYQPDGGDYAEFQQIVWEPLQSGVPAVYIITESGTMTEPPPDLPLRMEPMARFGKPYGSDLEFVVWRTTLPDA